jgi:hypothetical protein
MYCAEAVITSLKIYAEDAPAHQNFDHLAANAAALVRISKQVCRVLTQQLNNTSFDMIARWDKQRCRT